MIPHKATVKHDPSSGRWGDCFRASIASILDIEHVAIVPHFFDKGVNGEAAMNEFEAFLAERKMCPIYISYVADTFAELMEVAGNDFDVPYLVMGSTTDGGHCVICKGRELWHDVAWIKTPFVGGVVDNTWMIIYFGVKLNDSVC